MIVECSYCYRTVMAKKDGTCPSCGKRISSSPDVGAHPYRGTTDTKTPDRALMRVMQSQTFPDICCTCGSPSKNRVTVRVVQRMGGESAFVRFMIAIVRPLLLLLRSDISGTHREVSVRLPQCKACSRQGPLDPETVDFDTYSMKVIVHRDFRAACGRP